jgi:hypothetical protein
MHCQFHYLTKTDTITSPNLNLAVISNFDAPGNRAPQPSQMGHGFTVGVPPSFFEVARFQGRYVLRDGNHRAFGQLSRGITRVPAYVRDVSTAEDVAPAGTLPPSAWLGDRSSLLRDYHDDLVAEPLLLPVPHHRAPGRTTAYGQLPARTPSSAQPPREANLPWATGRNAQSRRQCWLRAVTMTTAPECPTIRANPARALLKLLAASGSAAG